MTLKHITIKHGEITEIVGNIFFSPKFGKANKVNRVSKIHVMFVSEISADGSFVTFL